MTILEEILTPLQGLSKSSDRLQSRPLGQVDSDRNFELPSYLLHGPRGGGDPVRIGLFAGIHGDEPAGPLALSRVAERLLAEPTRAEGYDLYLYPICNPTGLLARTRCNSRGKDLNREFWRNSDEPEVRILENEIRSRAFHGLISLHADDSSPGIYGYVRGAVLTRALLEPALAAAETVIPRNRNPVIDGFPAENGIISQCFDGILASPPELELAPFEIILETPQSKPLTHQADAFVVAIETVLLEYQKLLAFAANL